MHFVLLQLELQTKDGEGKPAPFYVRITNAPFNVLMDGYEFQATGDLLSVGDYETTRELTTGGIEISLSGVDPTYLEEMKKQGSFIRAPIDVYIASVPEGSNVASSAIFYHRGFADTPNVKFEEDSGQLVLGMETEGVFGDLDRSPDLMGCNFANHSSRHGGDQFFKFASNVSFGEEIWKTN